LSSPTITDTGAPAATDATLDRWARIAPPADLPVPLYGE